jgi:hypothetical protein
MLIWMWEGQKSKSLASAGTSPRLIFILASLTFSLPLSVRNLILTSQSTSAKQCISLLFFSASVLKYKE